MAKSPSDEACNPAPAVTSFLTTDQRAWLYLSVSGAVTGDRLRVEWQRPNGQVHGNSNFDPLPSSGGFCFDAGMQIAGADAANYTGTWTVRSYWNATLVNTLTFALSAGGGTTPSGGSITVDAQSNIFASGRSTADGKVPVSLRLTGGPVTFSRVTGRVYCIAGVPGNGPDGGTDCNPGTNVNSANGISGIRHDRKTLFLVGVFLGDSQPSGAAPSVLDFTNNENFTSLAPLLAQTFFIGDGYTSSGVKQQFIPPAGATRLFLGFADGYAFQGNPGYYTDNSGALTAEVDGGAAQGAGGGGGGTAGTAGNLIRNWDAEAGAATCATGVAIPSWTVSGGATVCQHGTGDYPANMPGPADRGRNLFAGGVGERASLTQIVDVSSSASPIDGGALGYELSGWLGGWEGQDDNAVLRITFRGSSGSSLGSASIGPVLAAERQSKTALLLKSRTGAVPAGTRSIEVVLDFTRTSGSFSDGIADNLSLTLGGTGGGGGGGTACSYSIAPTSQSVIAAGGMAALTVSAGTGCVWTATSNVNWITVSPPGSGTGNGTVQYQVAPNTSTSSRTGTLTVAGQTLTVTQAGAAATCSFQLESTAASVPAAGGTGSVRVQASASTCSWTATSSVGWISITSSSTGTGNGTVSYRVDANSGSSSRTGTMTVAGRTFTVTQAGAAPTCSYTILPVSASFPANKGAGSVGVTAASNCSWNAASNAGWISVTSGAAGTATGTVRYSVAANTGGAARTGTLTIANQTHTVNQAGASADAPSIAAGGIMNAASKRSAMLPNGGIAQGSIFTIRGTNLGPGSESDSSTAVTAFGLPLDVRLSEVSVKIAQGGAVVEAFLVSVWTNQIDAILPSNAPLGEVEVTVSYKGRSGAPAKARVVTSNFGAYTTGVDGGPALLHNWVSDSEPPVLNTLSRPARPGQTVILMGTGLGPISAPDNTEPPVGDLATNLEIQVGGKLVKTILYKGRAPGQPGKDQVRFVVPEDAPTGCYVPLQVKVPGTGYANVVRMSIDAAGARCSDPSNPASTIAVDGGKIGAIMLVRAGISAPVAVGQPAAEFTLDGAMATFQETTGGGEGGYTPLTSLPPPGTCVSSAAALDLSGLLTGGTATATGTATMRELDAGKSLSIRGPKGTMALEHSDTEAGTGPYIGFLGGALPIDGAPSLPLFLDAGNYTISGPGGKDVGAFSADITLATPLEWTNRQDITVVDRAAGVTFKWTPGDAARRVVLLLGGSTDEATGVSGGFFCLAPADRGTFTVGPELLGDLPATASTAGSTNSVGALALVTLPAGEVPRFTASGLDTGYVVSTVFNMLIVPFK